MTSLNDFTVYACRCIPPKAPLSTNIRYQSRGYQYYKLVTKLARRLHGNRRKYAGGEASQFKDEVETLQA
jgi:hypothetical protein